MQFGISRPLPCPIDILSWAPRLLPARAGLYNPSSTTRANYNNHGPCTVLRFSSFCADSSFVSRVYLSTYTPLRAAKVKLRPELPKFRVVQKEQNTLTPSPPEVETRSSPWEPAHPLPPLGEIVISPMRFEDLIERAKSMRSLRTANAMARALVGLETGIPNTNSSSQEVEDEATGRYIDTSQPEGSRNGTFSRTASARTSLDHAPENLGEIESPQQEMLKNDLTSTVQERRLRRSETSTALLEEELQWYATNDTSGSDVAAILKILIQDRQVKLGQNHYQMLLLANCNTREGSAENIGRIMQELQQAGFDINAATYTAALTALAVHPSPSLVAEILEMLHAQWIPFTPTMRHMVIVSMLRSQQIELANEALNVLHHANRSLPFVERDTVPLYVYLLLIRALVDQKDYEAVMRWIYRLHDRRATDRQIRGEFWSWLLQASAQDGDGWVAGWIWQDWVEQMRIRPSRQTCQNVFKIAARDGLAWLAESVRLVIEHGGTEEASRTERWARRGDNEGIDDGNLEFVAEMEKDANENEINLHLEDDPTSLPRQEDDKAIQEMLEQVNTQDYNATENIQDSTHDPDFSNTITYPHDLYLDLNLDLKQTINPPSNTELHTTNTNYTNTTTHDLPETETRSPNSAPNPTPSSSSSSPPEQDPNIPIPILIPTLTLTSQETQWIEQAYKNAGRIERRKAWNRKAGIKNPDKIRRGEGPVRAGGDRVSRDDLLGFSHGGQNDGQDGQDVHGGHNDNDNDGEVHNDSRDGDGEVHNDDKGGDDGVQDKFDSTVNDEAGTKTEERVRQIKPGNLWPHFKPGEGNGKLRFDPWVALGSKK